MRTTRGVVALLMGLVASVWAVPSLSDAAPRAGPAPAVHGTANDTTTPFNLVDVASLVRHRYDGHGLELTGVMHREVAFVRWAIAYRGDGLRLTGTLTLPNTSRPAPVVVVAHGWARPGTYRQGGGLLREEDALGRAGFAVLHPDYRNHAGSTLQRGSAPADPLGYPVDVVNAVLALRSSGLVGVDLTRVGLLGRSMGGGAALQAVIARPGMFRALQLYSPVSSLARDDLRRWVRPGSGLYDRVVEAYGTPHTNRPFWRRASARHYFDRIHIPVQIDHGTADLVCPFDWSVATARALRAVGDDVRLVPYPGERHRFERLWPRFRDATIAFWRTQLG